MADRQSQRHFKHVFGSRVPLLKVKIIAYQPFLPRPVKIIYAAQHQVSFPKFQTTRLNNQWGAVCQTNVSSSIFSFITLPNSLRFTLFPHAKISLSPTPIRWPPRSPLSAPVRADACHGSSDVSCLLSCKPQLAVVQQHIQQGLCNPAA